MSSHAFLRAGASHSCHLAKDAYSAVAGARARWNCVAHNLSSDSAQGGIPADKDWNSTPSRLACAACMGRTSERSDAPFCSKQSRCSLYRICTEEVWTREPLAEPLKRNRYICYEDHEPIVFPILLISPRSHACAASVLTRGCQIIRYLKPVITPGAFSTLILRFSASSPANLRGAVRINLVPGMHRVAAPKYGRVSTVRRR
jgi:hypothetical protein